MTKSRSSARLLLRTAVLLSICFLISPADAGFRKKRGGGDVERRAEKEGAGRRPGRKERKRIEREKAMKFAKMKAEGQDQIGMTKEAAELRSYELRKKKKKGLLRRKEASLAQVLFPGASPEDYQQGEPVPAFVEQVESKRTHLPFEFYDLPSCPEPAEKIQKRFRQRKNLGSRLMGYKLQMAPYNFPTKKDKDCT